MEGGRFLSFMVNGTFQVSYYPRPGYKNDGAWKGKRRALPFRVGQFTGP